LITAERINNWLQEPHLLKEIDQTALQQLADAYPYFSLIHLLSSVRGNDPGANNLFKRLHQINPVLLYEFSAGFNAVTAEESIATEATAYTGEPAEHTEPAKTGGYKDEALMRPVSADDYFLHQGIKVSSDIPGNDELPAKEKSPVREEPAEEDKEQSLLVMMSFSEWLSFINAKNKKEKEEEEDKKALKLLWQQQKLAAAIEEENDEIPEKVFEMAVNSIVPQDGLVSESVAEVYIRQGKKEKAIEMYQKLILLNPEKSVYFAHKIDILQKGT